MGRYLGGRCRLCRREGMKLFLKGTRCNTEKCSFAKRPSPPGMHTRLASKPTYYALQLREKQKVKRLYHILEKQFRRFFRAASKAKGVTGRKLLELLERRIDNVVYRSLFASTRTQARQLVRHGFIFIGERRINIPSYIVKEGETLELKAKDSVKQRLRETAEVNSKERSVPAWLDSNKNSLQIKVLRNPQKEDLILTVNEQLIVELYSK